MVVLRKGEEGVGTDIPAGVVGRAAGDEDGSVVGEDVAGEAVGEERDEALVEPAAVGLGPGLEVRFGGGLTAVCSHLEEGELFGRRHRR